MRWSLLIVAALALAGCAGYKLGPTNGNVAGSRSIQFRQFANLTHDARITQYLSTSLRKQLQADGTFRLETEGHPDILVSGEITKFLRNAVSYTTNDVLTPDEYAITLRVHMVAVDVHSGRTNLDRVVQGHTFIQLGNDQTSDERQAIPILTDDLAHNAISLLVDGIW